MKRIFFYFFAVITVCLSCNQPIVEHEQLEGLWVRENFSEFGLFKKHLLYFSGDSILIYGFHFNKYDLTSKKIIIHTKDTLFPFEYQSYQLKDETLIFSYPCDYCTLGTSYTHFKKSPFNNLIDAHLDSIGIKIDFTEYTERNYHYHNSSDYINNSVGNIFVGFDKGYPNKKIVIHNNQKVLLDSLKDEFKPELEEFPNVYKRGMTRWVYSSLSIDKNLHFSDYTHLKKALLSYGIYETNLHLNLNYTTQKLPEDFKYYMYRPITFLISDHEMETIKFPKTPLNPLSPSSKAIASNTITEINISWNDNNEIFINNEPIPKENFHTVIQGKYTQNKRGSIFILSPSSKSKVGIYFFIRNNLYQIHRKSRNEYLYKNHPRIPRDHPLPFEIQKEINDELPFIEQLNY